MNGRFIKVLRVGKSLSQADLARAVGKSRAWVSLVEIDARRIRPRDAKQLADVLGVDAELLTAAV